MCVFWRRATAHICLGIALLMTIESRATESIPEAQIAFLADIHFHDIHAKLGIEALDNEPALSLRSMQAQLSSTRLFNENYFVLLTALDDLVDRGIKLVALPGDFTDDGQPINVIALERILSYYNAKHGMRFFTITGNHDPVRPFTTPSGKKDFLALDGSEIAVYSPDHPRCKARSEQRRNIICHDGIKAWGYKEIMETMANHGFTSHAEDKLFETPFGSSDFDKRGWEWCDETGSCVFMPDASYLVEPVDGVWLLAIDANVYRPKGGLDTGEFLGSSNAGYNSLLTYKPQLIEWITSIVTRAKSNGKRLVAFSHFPMADFYDNTQADISSLFGEHSMQLSRLPTTDTTEALANTGLTLHMAGHMHLFDVHRYVSQSEQSLVNVQVPSLAAYQPGYSMVSLYPDSRAKVETILLENVVNFDALFPHYHKEWEYRKSLDLPVWAKSILRTTDYAAFTDAHLKAVVSQRYIKQWPPLLSSVLQNQSLGEIVDEITCKTLTENDEQASWRGLPGLTLAHDYYRIRNAGAFADISGRLEVYKRLLFGSEYEGCKTTNDEAHTMVFSLISLIIRSDTKEDAKELWIDGV